MLILIVAIFCIVFAVVLLVFSSASDEILRSSAPKESGVPGVTLKDLATVKRVVRREDDPLKAHSAPVVITDVDPAKGIRTLFLIILFICVGAFLYSRMASRPVLFNTIAAPGESIEVKSGKILVTLTATQPILEEWVYFDNAPEVRWIKYVNAGFLGLTPKEYEQYLTIKQTQCPAPFLNRTVRRVMIAAGNQDVINTIKTAKRGDHFLLKGFSLEYKDHYTGKSKYIFRFGIPKDSRLVYVSEMMKED